VPAHCLNNPCYVFLQVCYVLNKYVMCIVVFRKFPAVLSVLSDWWRNPSNCISLVEKYSKNVKILYIFHIYKTTFVPKNILKSFLHGFSSNQHIVQKALSEMYTSHFEHVWSSISYSIYYINPIFITSLYLCKT
jgi:hypothetical protein